MTPAEWERRVRLAHAIRARLEAREPRTLAIELHIDAVYRTLWSAYRYRDAVHATHTESQS